MKNSDIALEQGIINKEQYAVLNKKTEEVSAKNAQSSERQKAINGAIDSLGSVSPQEKLKIFNIVSTHFGSISNVKLADKSNLNLQEELKKVLQQYIIVTDSPGADGNSKKQITLVTDLAKLNQMQNSLVGLSVKFGAIPNLSKVDAFVPDVSRVTRIMPQKEIFKENVERNMEAQFKDPSIKIAQDFKKNNKIPKQYVTFNRLKKEDVKTKKEDLINEAINSAGSVELSDKERIHKVFASITDKQLSKSYGYDTVGNAFKNNLTDILKNDKFENVVTKLETLNIEVQTLHNSRSVVIKDKLTEAATTFIKGAKETADVMMDTFTGTLPRQADKFGKSIIAAQTVAQDLKKFVSKTSIQITKQINKSKNHGKDGGMTP